MSIEEKVNAADLNMIRTGPRGRSPVLFLHPVGLDLTYWDVYIDALRDAFDVVAIDLPGHGQSPGKPADWVLADISALVAEFIGSLSDLPAHVVGLSVGGMISQALAIGHPKVVRSLTLIDTAATFAEPARAGMRARAELARSSGMAAVLESTLERWFMDATRRDRPHLIDRVSKTLLSDDAEIHAAMWEMIAGLDLVDELDQIQSPALVLVGQFDPSSPPAAAELLSRRIGSARMHLIADASHMSPLEKPELVIELLQRFLAEQSDSYDKTEVEKPY